jgi:Tfp pilus assembly protein PilO
MHPQDYPIRHFSQMAEFASGLKSLPAIVCYRGVPVRVVFDGEEGELLVQRSTSRKAPDDWEAPRRRAIRSTEDLPTKELVDAVCSVVDAS